jgi:hypothetical protein
VLAASIVRAMRGECLLWGRHLLPAIYKASKKTPNHYIFTLKKAAVMFVETLYNFQQAEVLH